MASITLTGQTPAGAQITVTVDDPPQPESVELTEGWPDMVVGTTVDSTVFSLLEPGGRDAGSRFCRTFSGPGEGMLPWAHARRQVPHPVAEFHSFKDWPSDASAIGMINALLNNMPARLLDGPALLPELSIYDPDGYAPAEQLAKHDGFSFLVAYFHEGERDFIEQGLPVREWRRRHRLVYQTIRQHPNGHRVGYMPIQTGTWTEAASDPATGRIKGDWDPLAWWAGVGDCVGYDQYVPTVTNKPPAPGLYPAPDKFLAIPLQLARSTGRRLFLAEVGSAKQGTPADTGSFRGPWIRAVAQYAASQGVAGMAWWDDLGSKDFRLTDAPSAAAWAAVLAGEA